MPEVFRRVLLILGLSNAFVSRCHDQNGVELVQLNQDFAYDGKSETISIGIMGDIAREERGSPNMSTKG